MQPSDVHVFFTDRYGNKISTGDFRSRNRFSLHLPGPRRARLVVDNKTKEDLTVVVKRTATDAGWPPFMVRARTKQSFAYYGGRLGRREDVICFGPTPPQVTHLVVEIHVNGTLREELCFDLVMNKPAGRVAPRRPAKVLA